jgi:DNA-binding winged helix-turn-helix (wHTH) protein
VVRISFGECDFEPQARELRRSGRRIALPPRALELLQLLIEARPRALSKAELHDRLWPDTFVSDTSLAQVVTGLRKALGDNPRDPHYVRTTYRFGYAFCGPVQQPEAGTDGPRPSRFSVIKGVREILLHEGENLLGRVAEGAVRLDSEKASRRHARIVVRGVDAVLEDLDSKNGTFLNGQRVEGSMMLAEGDRIVVGRDTLVVCAGPPAGTTDTDLDDRRVWRESSEKAREE